MASTHHQHHQPILIVSSRLSDRLSIRQLLEKYAHEFPVIIEAESANDALRMANEHKPLCCVVDFDLPGQNGPRFLSRLRRFHPEAVLPVVVLADKKDAELAVRMLKSGAQDCLAREELTSPRLYASLTNALRSSRLQQQLQHLAHNDALTGLLNRDLLMNRLSLALKRCDRYTERCALLYIDLDNFKTINETYGHTTGDYLLKAVAERIHSNCRSTDSPARLSGDEFVVLLENVDNHTGRKVADKLMRSISMPFEVNGHNLLINVSIGLATYPDTARNAEELIKQADQALHQAKKHSLIRFFSFSERHKDEWARQHTLEKELPRAIENGELALAFQPIVAADSFRIERLEVLSRWPRNDISVNAMELIDMIDRLNLTEPFHDWLFHTAFSQMKTWQDQDASPDLCLNIPANYCYNSSISEKVTSSLAAHGIRPEKIELEITESTLMRFPERSVLVLQGMHELGLRIAVDDFGTGYSSMAYLTHLPLDTLKIDRNFFLAETHRDRNRKVIEAITALGHSLDLEIIAEGVETELQLNLAREVGCDLLQGYYFGRPAFPGGSWQEYVSQFEHITYDKI